MRFAYMTSAEDTFRELRVRLGSLRGFIAGAKMPALEEIDSLLSVAQAEVERVAAQNEDAIRLQVRGF